MQNWHERLKNGMTVISADGHKLGKLTSFDADGFTIEKGIYFPRDYLARCSDVASVEGDEVRLLVNRDALLPLEDRMKLEERGEWAPRGNVPGGEGIGEPRPKETIRVPELQEEDADAASGARRGMSGSADVDRRAATGAAPEDHEPRGKRRS